MSNTFTPLQRLCLDHYCEGEFKALTRMEEVYKAGDSLLTFVMLEASDMFGPYDMSAALMRAVDELRYVQQKLEDAQ